ncbi:DUF2075 domain-containing protein [Rathayibacter tritici]|uniref:Uncharacterized protein n=1 Tax=Rathayibacter tritici TaxID=33888 RepID=A0A160KS00_9MICO|nr:DNA/RNA helicase domain-containing protein [Rathayibacter tritici]AND16104.1 hypothetical protein A6122_0952 [Rathayibacter tritici]PPF64374.1 DUF2075 domain-containing protein [Rathayibacter tritici]PPG06882.1 DUF2075 domain-containing protein [Rathayibacter tritici]PPI42314.1 DUF2075 domain-containing protein [Rathayibacter tritici]
MARPQPASRCARPCVTAIGTPIIEPDLRYDPAEHRIVVDRANYHDKKGRENTSSLGLRYSDEDLLAYVRNMSTVLLTRGIRATYVCDAALRDHLAPYF